MEIKHKYKYIKKNTDSITGKNHFLIFFYTNIKKNRKKTRTRHRIEWLFLYSLFNKLFYKKRHHHSRPTHQKNRK